MSLYGSEAADLIAKHPAMRCSLDAQRAWIAGARTLAYRTAIQLDVAKHAVDDTTRDSAQCWCSLVTLVLKAACTQGAFSGASECLQVLGGHGCVREWDIEQVVRDARLTTICEGTNEIQAIDLWARQVRVDGGAGISPVLIEIRHQLDASRETDADVQRRLAPVRCRTTTLAMAAKVGPVLPYEVADDCLRIVLRVMLAWAWVRIDVTAAGLESTRRSRPWSAFRRSVSETCPSSRCGSVASSVLVTR